MDSEWISKKKKTISTRILGNVWLKRNHSIKNSPANPHTQIQNPMSTALRSGHANRGRANMRSERRPCTLLWLTLQHMNCGANRSASPWPGTVGATGNCNSAICDTVQRSGGVAWSSHTRTPVRLRLHPIVLFLASKHSYPTPPSQRAPTQVCSFARVFGPRVWMLNFSPGRILHPAPCLQTGPHVIRHKRVQR